MLIELIRHGETVLQKRKCYQGITDVPLSDEGRKKLKKAPVCPEHVYVTPLLRTKETADILFPGAGQIVVPGLSEMDFGVFEGKNFEDLKDDPLYREWVYGNCLSACPGGESRGEFTSRVTRAFSDLLDEAEKAGESRIFIVAHGGTQMAVLSSYADEKKDYYSWQLPCGSGYLLRADSWEHKKTLHVESVLSYI